MPDTSDRAAQIERFATALPDADVTVESTGGGCEQLAVRWPDDPKYYAVTDGEAGLPTDEQGQPLPGGGWRYIARHDDTDPPTDDYEGTVLAEVPEGVDISDAEVVEVIRRDRYRRTQEDLAASLIGIVGVDNDEAEQALRLAAVSMCENIADEEEVATDGYVGLLLKEWFSDPSDEVCAALTEAVNLAGSRVLGRPLIRFDVYEFVAGERGPVPGQRLGTYRAFDAIGALDAYSVEQGFAPYSATEMLNSVTVWDAHKRVASAPFTNYEIVACTDSDDVPDPPTRTILVHLNVEVPANDRRSADEIIAAVTSALEVGSDDDAVRDLNIVVPLAEEV